MHLVALRRYPVKSMGGEGLASLEVNARGLVGDRWFAVEDESGHFASGKDTRRFRRRDAVFSFTATTLPDGQVSVAGPAGASSVGSPELDEQLSVDLSAQVRILPERLVPHQDVGAESWVGRRLSVGSVTLDGVSRAQRCRMVDIAQDGFTPQDRLLKRLGDERDLSLAVYANVTEPGMLEVGDTVTIHG